METVIKRAIEDSLREALSSKKSILLLGARQTGKTTLVRLFEHDLYLTMTDIRLRQKYETNPGLFLGEIEALAETKKYPLIIVDEIQKVPALMDGIQYLIDEKIAQFIITGSSARKLKNFLPGRVRNFYLDPLSIEEIQSHSSLEDRLNYGALPEIFTSTSYRSKDILLRDYTENFIEEEIRQEAATRNIGHFKRFLELAAIESGKSLNLSKLSSDIGVAHTTISAYYTLLEECLVAQRFEPFLYTNTRRRLAKADKFIVFDLGIRRLAAKEGIQTSEEILGRLFEQYIGLELKKLARQSDDIIRIKFWKDTSGAEIDWIIEKTDSVLPIEVKWTSSPKISDAKHLQALMNEMPQIKQSAIICRVERPIKLSDKVTAYPWTHLPKLL